jgi:hypothetical protein
MVVTIRVKSENRNTGNISITEDHVQAYEQGLLYRIDVVLEETGEILESYFGEGLDRLMRSRRPYEHYYLAKRWLFKKIRNLRCKKKLAM